MPNNVSVLMEKPKNLAKIKVPISETGMVIAGITVLRQPCRNRKITTITMMMASTRVFSTSRMESRTATVVSTAT